jgi:uncharacterized heparinase superfamily protein
LSDLALYFHTVRHLRPVQVADRIWRRVYQPRADLGPAPSKRAPVAPYALPVVAPQTFFPPDSFRFLNVTRRCAAAADWRAADAARLWNYNLHYFHDLNAVESQARADWHRRLLERWVLENPPGAPVAWEPFPLSQRLVSWVKWAARGHEPPPTCHQSLAVQARWLSGRLEFHLLGNHLLANAKALVHAGLYFQGTEAERWLRRGLEVLGRELHEQVLADGGHFELSTMYHALVLEDLLDLINLMRHYGRQPPADWSAAAARMLRWLRLMSHPDGEIAFFNDAAFGVAATCAQLEAYASRLGVAPAVGTDAGLAVLRSSGYVRATAGPACLICDCAAVGSGYQPGHAHADTLSFELSLLAERLFVNSGVSDYADSGARHQQRGTAAHNTVIVDGQDSSEVWASFRVARRAHPRLSLAQLVNQTTVVEGSHDGYRRLSGRNVHKRRWILDAHSLRIEDEITGRFERAEARFHLHPELDARITPAGAVELRRAGEELATVSFERAAGVELGRGSWHPQFGLGIANSWISARIADSSLATQIRWPER